MRLIAATVWEIGFVGFGWGAIATIWGESKKSWVGAALRQKPGRRGTKFVGRYRL